MATDRQSVLEFVAKVRSMSPNIHQTALSKAVYAHFAYGVDVLYMAKLYNYDWVKILSKCALRTRPTLSPDLQLALNKVIQDWLAEEGPDPIPLEAVD